MGWRFGIGDRIGFVDSSTEDRSAEFMPIVELLADCGMSPIVAGPEVDDAALRVDSPAGARVMGAWIRRHGISAICYCWRGGAEEGLRLFSSFMSALGSPRDLASEGGGLRSVFFAGSSGACALVRERWPGVVALSREAETPAEVLDALGIPLFLLPDRVSGSLAYEDRLMDFGRRLVGRGEYLSIEAVDGGSPRRGSRDEGIAGRLADMAAGESVPLMRVDPIPALLREGGDAAEATDRRTELTRWAAELTHEGLVDMLFVGSPSSPEELSALRSASRPIFLGAYADAWGGPGRAGAPALRGDADWYVLSLWPSSGTGGERPAPERLRRTSAALELVSASYAPLEPETPGGLLEGRADELGRLVSGVVAARAAKAAGVRKLLLRPELGAPSFGRSLDGLAAARALLHMARELEDGDFKAYLQPSQSPGVQPRDAAEARARAAALAAVMDDIEPFDSSSPQIVLLPAPSKDLGGPALGDLVRITRQALIDYRASRGCGEVEDMSSNPLIIRRASGLLRDAREVLRAIESSISTPYCPAGMGEIAAAGFLASVDESGSPLSIAERIGLATGRARSLRAGPSPPFSRA